MPDNQQTAALWTRGVLLHDFGVSDKDIEFWMERTPDRSHAGALYYVKAPPGDLTGRSTLDLAKHPNVKFLFADPLTEGVRFYKKIGIYPNAAAHDPGGTVRTFGDGT